MSNKNLLNEATIRRFMKLADMEPLTNPFMDRLDEEHCGDRDTDMRPPAPAMEEDAHEDEPGTRDAYGMEEDAHVMGDRDMDDDAPEDDAMPEPEAMDEPVGADGALDNARAEEVEDLIGQFVQGLADTLGLDVDVEEDEAEAELDADPAGELDDAPMDDAPMDDAPMDDEEPEVMEETADEALEEETESALEEVTVVNDEDLIAEVAKRVTARLVKAMAKK